MQIKLKQLTFIISLAILCHACATSYQSRNSITGGYSSTKIQEGIYRVTFDGNSDATESRTADFAMLRSAEITLENGYPYFVILEGGSKSQMKQSASGGISQTYGSMTGYGNNAKFKGTTYDSGGSISTKYEPTSVLVIQCYKTKPNVSGTIFDASSVRDSIRAQYKIGQKKT